MSLVHATWWGKRNSFHWQVRTFVWASQLQKTVWGFTLGLKVKVRTGIRLTWGLRKLELKHVCAVSPRSLSHRYVVKVSESQEIWVEVVQLQDTGQQEGSRKQNTCKQLHCVVPFQTQVSKTDNSYITMCNLIISVCRMFHFCLMAPTEQQCVDLQTLTLPLTCPLSVWTAQTHFWTGICRWRSIPPWSNRPLQPRMFSGADATRHSVSESKSKAKIPSEFNVYFQCIYIINVWNNWSTLTKS